MIDPAANPIYYLGLMFLYLSRQGIDRRSGIIKPKWSEFDSCTSRDVMVNRQFIRVWHKK